MRILSAKQSVTPSVQETQVSQNSVMPDPVATPASDASAQAPTSDASAQTQAPAASTPDGAAAAAAVAGASAVSASTSSLVSGFSRLRPLLGQAAACTLGIGLAGSGLYVLVKEFPTLRQVIRTVGKASTTEVKPSSQQMWRTGVRVGAGIALVASGVFALCKQLPFNRA